MAKRQFAVFGLGKFGTSIAQTLAKSGFEVIAVDISEEKVQEIADDVTYAVRADVTEPGVLKSLGLGNIDAAVIAISENMEASVMATILVKEAGSPYVLAKASSKLHGTILKRIGADEVILPEQAMGSRVAKKLISGNFLDLFELSRSFSIVEIETPADWVGKTLKELDLRKKGINVIGIMHGDDIEMNYDPDKPIPKKNPLVLVAANEVLSKIV